MSAVDLCRRHTLEELVEMAAAVRNDPASLMPPGMPSLHLYTLSARNRLNEIGWAIYYHQRDGEP